MGCKDTDGSASQSHMIGNEPSVLYSALFSLNWPLGRFGLVVKMSVLLSPKASFFSVHGLSLVWTVPRPRVEP